MKPRTLLAAGLAWPFLLGAVPLISLLTSLWTFDEGQGYFLFFLSIAGAMPAFVSGLIACKPARCPDQLWQFVAGLGGILATWAIVIGVWLLVAVVAMHIGPSE